MFSPLARPRVSRREEKKVRSLGGSNRATSLKRKSNESAACAIELWRNNPPGHGSQLPFSLFGIASDSLGLPLSSACHHSFADFCSAHQAACRLYIDNEQFHGWLARQVGGSF